MNMPAFNHIYIKTAVFFSFIFCCSCSRLKAQDLKYLPEYQRSLSTINADTTSIFALITKASANIKAGNMDSMQLLLNEALAASWRVGFNDGIGQSLLGLGVSTNNKGDYAKAIGYFNMAIPYCKNAVFHKWLPAAVYNAIGVTCTFQSKYAVAVYYYYNALDYINQHHINHPSLLSEIYGNLGILWMRQGQYGQAIYYLKKAEQVAVSSKLYYELAHVYVTIGGVYIDDNKMDDGRTYSFKGLHISSYYKDSISQYCALKNIATSYLQSDPGKALAYYQESLNFASANPYYSQTDVFIGMSNAYFNQKDYKNAEKYISLGISNAKEHKMVESLSDATKGAAAVYAKDGNYQKAYGYLSTYSSLQDSLTNSQQITANHQLEVRYRTAEKDKDIIKKQLLITQQQNLITKKNAWIWGVSIGAALLVISLISISSSYRRKQLVQAKEMQIIKQTQEIAELKAMIKGEEKERTRLGRELHDGIGGLFSAFTMSFNTLGKENEYLANTKSYQKAAFLLKEISSEVRKTSHNMMPEVLQHHSLPEAVRQFCDYMQDSKNGSLNIVFQSFGDFDHMDNDLVLSTYRIIQELIQNIVKHAHATYALVQLIMRENILSITVEDNGIGFETDKKGDGMGLLNLRARIRSMNGVFSLESFKEKGTTVFIEFDLHTKGVIA